MAAPCCRRIQLHLDLIYPELDPGFAERLIDVMGYVDPVESPDPHENHWDESRPSSSPTPTQ